MSRVVVGMSGGVDSAVCAYLLKMAGYDVVGVTLRTWVAEDGKESRCCEIDDAEKSAAQIGIQYFVHNCIGEFKCKVIDPFIDDYINGLTPNPCVGCNRTIKWEKLLYTADVYQADYVATGHYASVIKLPNGRYTVKRADFADKDQTYMLYRLSQEQLSRTIMPLGGLSKPQVRELAMKAGLHVADKADSQEICFVMDGNYADYIEANAEKETSKEGFFVDEEGKVLGKHKGIIHYTVGQRKGLGIALGYPAFVKEIDPEKNEVVICREDALFTDVVYCRDLNFLSIPGLNPGEQLKCRAKIRYHHEAKPAVIEMISGTELKIVFEEPVRAATPGQSAVFYDADDCVIGGGVIMQAKKI